jgi:hypothetical protein
MRSSLTVLALLSAGCATTPPAPVTVVQHVYCLTPEQFTALVKAKPAKVGGTLTGNAQQDFKIVAGQDVLLGVYSDGLLTVLGGCVGN